MKQTKIVATISDWRSDISFLTQLYDAGMNVVRMNSAHLDEVGIQTIIDNTRAVSPHIALLVDTKGPEVRTTVCEEPIELKEGDELIVKGNTEGISSRQCIYVNYPNFIEDIIVGSDLLLDDGELDLKVVEKTDSHLLCRVLNDGVLGSRKSVNVPGVRINLPSLTEKDKRIIDYAIKQDIEFIAHSFVRNRQDVLDIQEILDKHHSKIKIIAKIENQDGVDNIDEILEVAYGVMVARGDLAIEVGQEKIPGIQRVLIKKCIQAKKPVIVATQMLHSMIKSPRPTRAEVTDIANAIYYRTDALMLSGETAYGKYPVEALVTMSRVAEEAEKTKLSDNDIRIPTPDDDLNVTAFLAKQAVKASIKLDVSAIITDSYSGTTARNIAAFRGRTPVFAFCYSKRTMRELSLSYGVEAFFQNEQWNTRHYMVRGIKSLIDKGHICADDLIVYLSGRGGEGKGTTFLEITDVNEILGGAGTNGFAPQC